MSNTRLRLAALGLALAAVGSGIGVGYGVWGGNAAVPRRAVGLTPTPGQFAPYPPGHCHAVAGGVLPDPSCTPGATNPDVTQATISQTICVSGWTAMIRPPVGVTGPEKVGSMAAYGDGTNTAAWEFDHLVPLEVGGAPNDNLNLWPEPHVAGVNQGSGFKDAVENLLKSEVCAGTVTLADAQYWIAHDWTRIKPGPLPSIGPLPPQPTPTTVPVPTVPQTTATTPTQPPTTTSTTPAKKDADYKADAAECGHSLKGDSDRADDSRECP